MFYKSWERGNESISCSPQEMTTLTVNDRWVASTFQSRVCLDCGSGCPSRPLPWKPVRGQRKKAVRKFWVFVDGQLKPVFHLLLHWAWQVVEPLSGLLREYKGDHVSWVLGLHFTVKATLVFYAMGSFTGLILKEEPPIFPPSLKSTKEHILLLMANTSFNP